MNIKYQIPNMNYAQTKERATNQIQKLQYTESKSPNSRTKTKQQQTSLTVPNCNPEKSNNQNKREHFSHTHTLLFLSNFLYQHYAYIGDLSRLIYPKPRRTRLLFHTQKENHSYSKRNSKSSSRQDF